MAQCIYNLMGRIFNSEMELDNFLLNNKLNIEYGRLSDIVFDSDSLLSTTITVIEEAKKAAEKVKGIKELKRLHGADYLTQDLFDSIKDYLGVTTALSKEGLFLTERGTLFVPKWVEIYYKNKLEEQWKRGLMEPKHLLLLGLLSPVVDNKTTFNKLFELLKKSWERTAVLGSANHRIFELFWENVNNNTDQRVDWYKEQIDKEFPNTLTYEQVDAAVAFIKAFRTTLMYDKKFSNAKFYAEYPITMDTTVLNKDTGTSQKLIGIIDLLVIDNDGVPHIFDYKLSSSDPSEWKSVKERTHMYQLGFYRAGLQALGLDTSKTTLSIIPLELAGFDGNTYERLLYSKEFWLSKENKSELSPFGDIHKNINSVVVIPEKSIEVSHNFIPTVEKQMKQMFPSYRFLKDLTEDMLDSIIEKELWYVKSLDEWRLRNYSGDGTGMYKPFKSKEDAIKYIKEKYHAEMLKTGENVIKNTIGNIKRAIKENNPGVLVNFKNRRIKGEVNPLWFYDHILRFCTIDWEVVELGEFELLGTLVLHNIRGDYYTFIAIDGQNTYAQVKFKKGKKITGSFVDDITPLQNGVDLLDGVIGNVINMRTMLAINAFPELFKRTTGKNASIGEILMLNPKEQRGCNATTKLLRDNFRLLCSYANIKNNFENGTINCLLPIDLAIETLIEFGGTGDVNKGLNKIYSIYEHNPETMANNLESLTKVKLMLEEQYPNLTKKGTIDLSSPEAMVYWYINRAIQKLNGIEHVLELKDGNSFWHNVKAPAVQSSKNLQDLSKTAKNAIRLIKKDANEFVVEFRERYDKFKKAKGYTLGRRLVLNDELVLFKNMFREDKDLSGIWKFKNPWKDSMDKDDAEFLKYVLDTLYKYKHLGEPVSLDTLDLLHLDSESDFFDVPLLINRNLKDKLLTKQGRNGLITWIKEKIEWWRHPIKNIKRLDIRGLSDEDAELYYRDAELYRIFDIFSSSDDPDRRFNLLKDNSVTSYNQDVGEIMLEYAVAKIRKKYLDKYLPVLQAYSMTTLWESNFNNIDMKNNLKYIMDFVNSKILDVSLVPDDYKPIAKGLSILRNITTVSTLGLSTKSLLFQRMEGAFKHASRSLIRPEGVSQFGWEEVSKAIKIVEGSTKDFGKVVFLCELLNEAYSLNDQDSNNTAKRLKQGALPNDFMGQMLWFTSIPDYYNRLTMFVALMLKDGCFEAHKVVGTRLVYDWKLDKRFSVFANANGVVPTDPEKRKIFFYQKALYIKKMEELRDSNYMVTDKNGVERPLLFDPLSNKPEDDLPMAYTFNEANNLKSFSDRLYGYYNHEDLSLWKSRLLGASHMQFRAWWSSLRDRWFLKPDVYGRTNGRYEQGTIPVAKLDHLGNPITDSNGDIIYENKPAFVRYFVDENGKITGFELTDEDTEVPYIIWKGSYMEGMARTFMGGLMSIFNGDANIPLSQKCLKFIKGDWDPNANEDVKRVRLTNMQLIAHDFLLWAIIGWAIGGILMELLRKQRIADRNKKLSFGEMTGRNVENILVSSLIASTQDLGALSDLISPLADWTPPSFSVVGRMWKDGMKVISGDETFGRAVLSNISIARQTREYWWKATAKDKN